MPVRRALNWRLGRCLAAGDGCACGNTRQSIGIIEGLNNKAKVTMRKAYGYRTFRIAELSLYHVLGRLPEPKLAHRFF